MNLEQQITAMAKSAQKAARQLVSVSTTEKNKALKLMAKALLFHQGFLISENKKDLTAAAHGQSYSKALIERLTMREETIKEMAQCLLDTAKLKDPVGELMDSFKRPNGLLIQKIRVPIGVVAIVYESRPNVTSDAIGLCLKSSNAAILKGGREALYSNGAIFKILRDELSKTEIPIDAIQLLPSDDHRAFGFLLKLQKYVDVVIPRGGEELIRFVTENTRIPVIKHYQGICHTYVSEHADLNMAHKICMNAKVQKPGVCNAMETMLVAKDAALRFLPVIVEDMQKAGVEIRGCRLTRTIVKKPIKAASEKDWDTEYLDLILSVKVVHSLEEAIDHINTHGSHHSDCIVTEDKKEAKQFLQSVDSACLYVNASTRFTDGHQFGFGAEIGISTDKLHARGPMALNELTTYKYLVFGKGQVRQ